MLRVTNNDAPDWPSMLYGNYEQLFVTEVDEELGNNSIAKFCVTVP